MTTGCRFLVACTIVVALLAFGSCSSRPSQGTKTKLQSVLSAYSNASFSVTFKFDMLGSGNSSGELVSARDVTGRQSILVRPSDEELGWVEFVVTSERFAVCSNKPQGGVFFSETTNPQGDCAIWQGGDGAKMLEQSAMKDVGALANPLGGIGDLSDYTVTNAAARTIIGRKADCYRGERTTEAASFEICFDADAIMLYRRMTESDGSKSLLEATSMRTPDDSDFALPYRSSAN